MEVIPGVKDNEASSPSLTGTQHMLMKRSLKMDLPPSLNIKSTDLKMMDLIGQGDNNSYCN